MKKGPLLQGPLSNAGREEEEPDRLVGLSDYSLVIWNPQTQQVGRLTGDPMLRSNSDPDRPLDND